MADVDVLVVGGGPSGLTVAEVARTGARECVGYPAPDFEMFLGDGSTVRLYELLRPT